MPLPISTVAVFDLDRTITRLGTYTPFLWQCLPDVPAAYLRVPEVLAAGVAYAAKLMTRNAVKARMLRLTIAGTPRDQVTAWSEAFVGRWLQRNVRPGALEAIARHRAAGDHLVLATASFDFYAGVFASRLGFHHVIATASVWDESGRLQPQLGGENCYGPVKFAAVQAYLATMQPKPRVVAYSDHHSDFDLLRGADEGIAVNPSRGLRRMAQVHGLQVVDWDKAA
jgi:phosphatidylglycerophosphatase C